MRKVVITGMGQISSLGNTVNDLWNNIVQGNSGISPLKKLPTQRFDSRCLASEVDENLCEYPNTLLNESNAIKYAYHAISKAIEDSGLKISSGNNYSLHVGSTNGNSDILQKAVDNFVSQDNANVREGLENMQSLQAASTYWKYRPVSLISTLCDAFGLEGEGQCLLTACAAGNYAVGDAYVRILNGTSDMAIAGGVDCYNRSCYSVFFRLKGMTYDTCRPFDQNRSGIVVGEGAGMLILESEEHARARGARIYGEIKGVGYSCDAHNRVAPHPEGDGAALAMRKAIDESALKACDIDLISTHGTATRANDVQEYRAMKSVFEESLSDVSILTSKANLGHCMGAASALESIIALLCLYNNVVPPNANTVLIDEEFADLNFYKTARSKEVKNVINNAFGFGGNVCSLVIGEV